MYGVVFISASVCYLLTSQETSKEVFVHVDSTQTAWNWFLPPQITSLFNRSVTQFPNL